MPLKQKQIHLVAFPSIANTLLDLAVSKLSDKVQRRVSIHKDVESLKKYINPDILPAEYGGKVAAHEMILTWKKIMQDC